MGKKFQHIDDEKLVAGCAENNRYDQEMLYRKYFDRMLRMCLRYTKDETIALEIINNGFLRVFKKIDRFQGKGSLEGWIRKLVFHALADYFKKASQEIRFLDLEDWDTLPLANPIDKLQYDDLVKLIEELPKATREVFYLYAIEGYTHPEIATLKGISVGTSKWHLSAARKTTEATDCKIL